MPVKVQVNIYTKPIQFRSWFTLKQHKKNINKLCCNVDKKFVQLSLN